MICSPTSTPKWKRHVPYEDAANKRANRTIIERGKIGRSSSSLLIRVCLGCGAPSQVANHIVPLGARGDDVLLSPIQPLCFACHGIKFALEMKFKRGEVTEADLMMDSAVAQAFRRSKPAKYACDVNGISLDPNHPWRQELNRRKGLK